MDLPAVGSDVVEDTWKQNSRGKEKEEARQQATGEGFWTARRQHASIHLPESQNTIYTVIIDWVSNSKEFILAHKQLQASYTDVRH
jgi:hypothetical protein